MSEKKVRIPPLTVKQLDLLIGMKYAGTPEGPEREFYSEALGNLNNLSRLLSDCHPRRHDTSQDVDEDEDDDGDSNV